MDIYIDYWLLSKLDCAVSVYFWNFIIYCQGRPCFITMILCLLILRNDFINQHHRNHEKELLIWFILILTRTSAIVFKVAIFVLKSNTRLESQVVNVSVTVCLWWWCWTQMRRPQKLLINLLIWMWLCVFCYDDDMRLQWVGTRPRSARGGWDGVWTSWVAVAHFPSGHQHCWPMTHIHWSSRTFGWKHRCFLLHYFVLLLSHLLSDVVCVNHCQH